MAKSKKDKKLSRTLFRESKHKMYSSLHEVRALASVFSRIEHEISEAIAKLEKYERESKES